MDMNQWKYHHPLAAAVDEDAVYEQAYKDCRPQLKEVMKRLYPELNWGKYKREGQRVLDGILEEEKAPHEAKEREEEEQRALNAAAAGNLDKQEVEWSVTDTCSGP